MEHTNPEPPGIVFTEGTTVALCAKNESENEITQATATDGVENVNSDMTDILAQEVQFDVPQYH